MSPVPHLSARDLELRLDQLCQAERRHFVFALHGTGDPARLHLSRSGRDVDVVPVRSELDLRRHMLALSDDRPTAFLVPWEGMVPMDLGGRFARRGEVFRVGRETRLLALFGAVERDDDVLGHPLVEHLLQFHAEERFASAGRVTAALLWESYLARIWRLQAPGGLALDVLLGFAAVDNRGPEFVRLMEERKAAGVREALLGHLERTVGPAAPLTWQAWEAGRGRALLGLAVLTSALDDGADAAGQVWWKLTAHKLLGWAPEGEALRQLADASEPALRAIEGRGEAGVARAIVAEADGWVIDEVRPALLGSRRLPSAWRARLAALGDVLGAGAADPTREAVREALERLRGLSSHLLFHEPEQTLTVERAEMAVRLLGWLATRPDKALVRSRTPYAEVECLAQWYAAEGGYVDWARRWARASDESPLGAGIAAVVAAADAEREALDWSFARALPSWLEARRPAGKCVPIDHAVARVAGAFLDGNPERRLLVLLMDGMAWAQLVEILGGLGTEAAAWGPIAWHAMARHRIGDGPYPAVLAGFPTITDVSRSAFFAGKPVASGKTHDTAKDPDRWKGNRTALALAPERDLPRLLLRGDGHTRDGGASPEALSLVGDPARRLVAVVINAIDSYLKGDAAHRVRWTADSIKSLRDLLEKARQVGRSVLLCADHGHVPADRLEAAGGARTAGARWRPWESPSDPVADWEVALSAEREGVWAPRGAHGVVLAADDRHKYGGGASAGEHGGASLAEVVAPCLLVGCEDSPAAEVDPALHVRPAQAPAWWHFDVGTLAAAAGGTAAVPVQAGRPRRKRTTDNQLPLLGTGRVEPPTAAPEPERASPLADSKVLQVRATDAALRRQVIDAVEYLLARGGVAGTDAFAAAMGVFAPRVAGVVSCLQEVLNADGYEVLRLDRRARQVHLDRGKLAMLFEVTL